MRWPGFILLAGVMTVLQCTVGSLLGFRWAAVGLVGPDLLAIVAVFVALRARNAVDVMLAAWTLGMALDVTTAWAGGGTTAIGPMSLAYALVAAGVFRIRDAFYYERPLPRALLAMLFCGAAHTLWITLQSLAGPDGFSGQTYGRMLLQAGALALYTAVLTPPVALLLGKTQRLFLVATSGGRRSRRGGSN